MSNSFNLLEHASNSDPLEIASSAKKEVKQEKPKVEEKKPVQQIRKPKPTTSAPSEVVEEGFQGTRSKTRGGRQQHQGYQPPKKGRTFDRHVSGTGRGKEVKKGGGGKANWGKSTEQTKEEKPVEVEQSEQSEAVGEQQPTEEKKEEAPSSPVDTSLTLEEYLNQKKTSKIKFNKEAGEQLVTGKTVKISETAFERSSEELFQKEKKKVEKAAEKKSASSKPKTVAVSEFLDTASIEKIKERRDKELLEGPKQPRGPRQDTRPERGERGDRKGVKPQNKGPKTNKPASGQKKPRPVINKEKDFPALSPQN